MLTALETALQVHWYSENHPNASREDILAVTPSAAYACQELSLRYSKIEDHCRYSQRFEQYTDILREYLIWEAWLDDWSQKAIPEFKDRGFRPASAVTFPFQLLFAEIWATATNLREFVESTKPGQVAFWRPRITEVPWFLQPLISPATALLPDILATTGIEAIDRSAELPQLVPESRRPNFSQSPITRLKNWAKSYLRQSQFISEMEVFREYGHTTIFARLKKGQPKILVSGYGYDLEPLILELLRKGIGVTRLRENSSSVSSEGTRSSLSGGLSQRLADAGAGLLQEPNLWKPLERWGLGQTQLLARPLQHWWHSLVPALWLRYQQTDCLLKRKNYLALITTDCGATTWGGPTCQAASASGLNRFLYQHGGSTCADGRMWQMNLRGSDVVLVAGEGTAQELQQSRPSYLHPFARIVSVGSSRLDKLSRRHVPEKSRKLRDQLQSGDSRPIVMYVPNAFGTFGRAVSDLAGYPEVSYLELQQTVLRLFAETPEVRLLYKDFIVANDSNRFMPNFVRKQIPNSIISYQRLSDLMWSVDAIILDHALTALSETVLTKKRLIVYLPQPNSSSLLGRTLLRKRATVAETQDEFIKCVKDLLAVKDFSELEEPNDEFLRMYCTHAGDGRSAERAATAVLENISMAGTELAQETSG